MKAHGTHTNRVKWKHSVKSGMSVFQVMFSS